MIFGGKIIEHKNCALIFSTSLSETFLIKNNSVRHYHNSTLILMQKRHYYCQTSTKLEFFDRFSKNTQYQISRKLVLLEPSCSMRYDGRTDVTELTVLFATFLKPKNKDCVRTRQPIMCVQGVFRGVVTESDVEY